LPSSGSGPLSGAIASTTRRPSASWPSSSSTVETLQCRARRRRCAAGRPPPVRRHAAGTGAGLPRRSAGPSRSWPLRALRPPQPQPVRPSERRCRGQPWRGRSPCPMPLHSPFPQDSPERFAIETCTPRAPQHCGEARQPRGSRCATPTPKRPSGPPRRAPVDVVTLTGQL
jgi:hypothetical protein